MCGGSVARGPAVLACCVRRRRVTFEVNTGGPMGIAKVSLPNRMHVVALQWHEALRHRVDARHAAARVAAPVIGGRPVSTVDT